MEEKHYDHVVSCNIKEYNQEDYYLADELMQQVNQVLSKMPADCQQAFALSKMDGCSHAEIAKRMNVKVKRVTHLLYKTVLALKKAQIDKKYNY